MDAFTSGFFLRFVSSVKTWSSSRPCPLHGPAAGPAHVLLAPGHWLLAAASEAAAKRQDGPLWEPTFHVSQGTPGCGAAGSHGATLSFTRNHQARDSLLVSR